MLEWRGVVVVVIVIDQARVPVSEDAKVVLGAGS